MLRISDENGRIAWFCSPDAGTTDAEPALREMIGELFRDAEQVRIEPAERAEPIGLRRNRRRGGG